MSTAELYFPISCRSYGLIAALPILSFVRLPKVVDNSSDYTILHAAGHSLFLQTSPEAKYTAKFAFTTRSYALLNAALVVAWPMLVIGIRWESRPLFCTPAGIVRWQGVAWKRDIFMNFLGDFHIPQLLR